MEQNRSLASLEAGQSALVARLGGAPDMCRRLRDLGLIPGTRVTCLGKSPAGDPAAFLFRGAVIALRAAVAGRVDLEEPESPAGRPGRAGAAGWG